MALIRRTDGVNSIWRYSRRTWTPMGVRAPRDRAFFNISCTSRSFCMATVGDSFTYLRWDGNRWHRGRFEVGGLIADPASVSCTSRLHCVLAGTFIHPQSAEWNGNEWTRLRDFDAEPPEALGAASCAGDGTWCLALDIMGAAFQYVHHTWRPSGRHDPGWGITVDVSCGNTMCLAPDEPGGYVRTSGHGWTEPRRAWRHASFGARGFAAISCATDTFCLALQGNGVARRYDGRRWRYAGRSPVGAAALSCLSARWCAAMDAYTGRVAKYRDGSWHTPVGHFPEVGEPWQLSCGSRTMCVATTGYGITRVFDGTAWGRAKTMTPTFASAGEVSCVRATFCMVVAGGGVTWRYDGIRWHRIPINANPLAIACTSRSFCAELDTDGVQLFDGHSWAPSLTSLPQPENTLYSHIDCAGRLLCVLASSGNRVVVGTGA
jgi:hypothetical protein